MRAHKIRPKSEVHNNASECFTVTLSTPAQISKGIVDRLFSFLFPASLSY